MWWMLLGKGVKIVPSFTSVTQISSSLGTIRYQSYETTRNLILILISGEGEGEGRRVTDLKQVTDVALH